MLKTSELNRAKSVMNFYDTQGHSYSDIAKKLVASNLDCIELGRLGTSTVPLRTVDEVEENFA